MLSAAGGNADDWRSQAFRQTLIRKIEDAILQCGAPTTKNAMEMEGQVYAKAKSREEYLSFVGRLIMHIQEMAGKKAMAGGFTNQQNLQNSQQATSLNAIGPNSNQQLLGIQSSINATSGINTMNINTMAMNSPNTMNMSNVNNVNQNLSTNMMSNMSVPSSTGLVKSNNFVMGPGGQIQQQQQSIGQASLSQSPSPIVQSNILQQLNQQQVGQQQLIQQQQLNQQQMMSSQNFMQQSPSPQINTSMMQNTPMQGSVPMQSNVQMQNMLNSAQQQHQMITQASVSRGIPNPQQIVQQNRMMQSPVANQLSQIAAAHQLQQRKVRNPGPNIQHADGTGMPGASPMPNQFQQVPGSGSMIQRSMGPGQFMQNAGPAVSMAPSPGSMNVQNQMASQPGYANSPGQAMMHSPAAPGVNVNTYGRPYGNQMVPSPSGVSLNTPLMAAPTPSPRNAEDQACLEKIKELRRYTDLLQRMIAKIGNEDVEKSSKMKKLLDILISPNQRVSMEILLKCEIALKKMERQHDAGGLGSVPQVQPLSQQPQQQMPSIPGKETASPFQQLLDVALSTHKLPPTSAHTFRRTFRQILDPLIGTPIWVEGEKKEEEPIDAYPLENGIPYILAKEIRLLDPSVVKAEIVKAIGDSDTATISFTLVDPKLPCVPPVYFNVTKMYPDEKPNVVDFEYSYSPTPFLRSVADSMKSRLIFLPKQNNITQFLRCWQMSVRQAAKPISYGKSAILGHV